MVETDRGCLRWRAHPFHADGRRALFHRCLCRHPFGNSVHLGGPSDGAHIRTRFGSGNSGVSHRPPSRLTYFFTYNSLIASEYFFCQSTECSNSLASSDFGHTNATETLYSIKYATNLLGSFSIALCRLA